MNKEEIKPKVLYRITAYDRDYIKETPDKVRTLNGNIYYYYDFKKHRYLSQFVNDDFDIYDELKSKQDKINKAIEWINNHIDTFEERNITIYDWNSLSNPKELLEILGGKE